jgi:hypothetical protein
VLRDFRLDELLAFISGWHPDPGTDRWRWKTWTSYLADFSQLRAELEDRHAARILAGRPLFAARVARFVTRHGLPALEEVQGYDLLVEVLDDDEVAG